MHRMHDNLPVGAFIGKKKKKKSQVSVGFFVAAIKFMVQTAYALKPLHLSDKFTHTMSIEPTILFTTLYL